MLFIEIIKSLFIYSNFHPFYFTKLVFFLFCWMWMHLRAAQWSSPSLWFFSRGVIQASILANKLTIKTLMRSQKKNLLNLPPPPSHSHRSFFSQITFCCFFLKRTEKNEKFYDRRLYFFYVVLYVQMEFMNLCKGEREG